MCQLLGIFVVVVGLFGFFGQGYYVDQGSLEFLAVHLPLPLSLPLPGKYWDFSSSWARVELRTFT